MLNILLLDNHDSFSYNLAAMFNNYKNVNVKVQIPENTNIEKISEFDKIIFSPGPGISTEVPFMDQIMKLYHKTHSILGVCLGYQAISLHFGGSISKLQEVNHGKQKKLNIIDSSSKIYQEVPQNSGIGLYHSWVLNKHDLPKCMKITGICEDGNIMSVEHKEFPLFGLQFHPESFVTEYGSKIIDNWLKI
ncbi:MAG: aminodeoxychorismate/anthranilate synthase component II [Marinilabiliales bacterium]|nr:MAG: aminodeoxychorismate/anthranilate synthase component II [Marinilabiliales bacterium]